MPTFQTTPYMNWVFPDQAYHMNHKKGMVLTTQPPPLDNMSHMVSSHSHWHDLAKKEALGRVSTNKKKEEGMLGKLNTTARSQRYTRPASRSAVPNGVFHGPAMLYSANAGIRGGHFRTKEGQEWLERRLQERKQEYEMLSSGQFKSRPTPEQTTPVSPNTDEIDTYLQELFTAIGTSVYGTRSTELASKLLNAIFKQGASLDEHEVVHYIRTIDELIISLKKSEDGYGLAFGAKTQEVKRTMDYVRRYMMYCRQLLEKISEVIYEPEDIRQSTIAREREIILSKTQKEIRQSTIGTPESELPPPPQMGPREPPAPINPPRERYPMLRKLAKNAYGDLEGLRRRAEI